MGKVNRLLRGQRGLLKNLQEKIHAVNTTAPGAVWWWFHCASVGECEQAKPLMERVRKYQPQAKILLTFFSPSGYELLHDYRGADVVSYLPLPFRHNAKRFLDIVKPGKAVFIKYEFWAAYLRELRKRHINTYSVASVFRPQQAFFRPLIGNIYRSRLRCFTCLIVQDGRSKELLNRYGIDNVTVGGDTRFNRVAQISANPQPIPLIDRFVKGMPENLTQSTIINPQSCTLVAGSTWLKDEQLLKRYIDTHPQVRLILVPHEIDDTHLHRIFQLFEGRYIRLTQANFLNVDTCRILVVDTLGLLSSIYQYADAAYIGGGFGKGIHNTLEAATYGIPVVWGRNYHRFREAQGLIDAGAGQAVSNYEELEAALDKAFLCKQTMGKAARNYVESEIDAADKIYEQIVKTDE